MREVVLVLDYHMRHLGEPVSRFLLDEAQHAVLQLMKRDYFPVFREHSIYREYREKADQQVEICRDLKGSSML